MINHGDILGLLSALFTFLIIVVASNEIAKVFQKIKLPLITGFILIGVIAGPDILKMIPRESLDKLFFIDEVALAFIAFAAGNEMFLKELKGKLRKIGIMTAAQFFITFIVSFVLLMMISERIPFMAHQPKSYKIAIALLIATIFIARSPASAIAIINELRAKGPFTQIALGVTIVKDILVILLFTVTFSVAGNLINNIGFDVSEIVKVFFELLVSIGLGALYARIMVFMFSLKMNQTIESLLFLFLGWTIFGLSNFIEVKSFEWWHLHFHVEPLLSGIIASFCITNNTKYRLHLQKIIEGLGSYVYVAFFTKVGADIETGILIDYWQIAVMLFAVRIFAIIIASFTGSILIRDNWKNTLLSWTPYITQAGVSLGLITVVAKAFPMFGTEFETILVAVIIINQFVGPPLMKWAIISAGEAHKKAPHSYDGVRDVIIFGLENLSINLAHSLQKQNWNVQIVTDDEDFEQTEETKLLDVIHTSEINVEFLKKINTKAADAVVLLMTDYKNLQIAEMIYTHFGTPTIIVRIEDFGLYPKFKELNALVVEPSTAMANLLEQFVRAPHATSLLFGMEEGQLTMDIEVLNPELHGKALRDIRLPLGVLVLSISRNHQTILTHGYTRLRLHDVVTVLGSPEQLEQVRIKLQF